MKMIATCSFSADDRSKMVGLEQVNKRLRERYIKVGLPSGGKVMAGEIGAGKAARAELGASGVKDRGRLGRVESAARSFSKDAEDQTKTMADLAYIAAVHEYGSRKKNIPERSFLRTAIDENRDKIFRLCVRMEKLATDGKMNVEDVFKTLGIAIVDMVKKKISTITEPELKQKTIDRKHSSKPLIDTGQMRNSMQFKVVSK